MSLIIDKVNNLVAYNKNDNVLFTLSDDDTKEIKCDIDYLTMRINDEECDWFSADVIIKDTKDNTFKNETLIVKHRKCG